MLSVYTGGWLVRPEAIIKHKTRRPAVSKPFAIIFNNQKERQIHPLYLKTEKERQIHPFIYENTKEGQYHPLIFENTKERQMHSFIFENMK